MSRYVVLVQGSDDYEGEYWKKGEYDVATADEAIAEAWRDAFYTPSRSGSRVKRVRCVVAGPDVGWVEYDVFVEAKPADVRIERLDR